MEYKEFSSSMNHWIRWKCQLFLLLGVRQIKLFFVVFFDSPIYIGMYTYRCLNSTINSPCYWAIIIMNILPEFRSHNLTKALSVICRIESHSLLIKKPYGMVCQLLGLINFIIPLLAIFSILTSLDLLSNSNCNVCRKFFLHDQHLIILSYPILQGYLLDKWLINVSEENKWI